MPRSPSRPPPPPRGQRPTRRRAFLPLAVAGAAVAAGLLVFAVVVWRQPAPVIDADGAPRARIAGGNGSVPLPAPGVSARQAIEMPRATSPADADADAAGEVSEPPARLVEAPPSMPASVPPAAAPPAPGGADGSATRPPVPTDMPPPRYPADALRRGETGEVLLRVQVDERGLPADVEVLQSSGSRALDRAAVAAAQRWRFQPAQREGMVVAGSVEVPISFDRPR